MKVLGITGEPTTDDYGNVSAFIRVEGSEGSVLLRKKPPFVEVGQDLTGYEIKTEKGKSGKEYKKLVRVQQNGWGGGNKSGGQMDPAREKRIVRQHSQDMALRMYELALNMGLIETKPASVKELWTDGIKPLIDALDKDALGAGE